MHIILWIIYILIGLVLSVPYTLLANGSLENFVVTAWIAPAATFFLCIIYMTRGIGRKDGKAPRWGGAFFWIAAAYFCLPIILNGISVTLRWSGHSALGDLVFSARYLSLAAIPVTLLIALAIFGAATSLWERLSGTGAPPNPPNRSTHRNLQKLKAPKDSRLDNSLRIISA